MTLDPRWSLLAFLSCLTSLSLGVTGEVPLVSFGMPFAVALAVRNERKGVQLGPWGHALFRFLILLAVFHCLYAVVTFRMLPAFVGLTLPIQAYYLLEQRTHRFLWSLQLLTFFQLVALAAATTKLFFVLTLLPFLMLVPAASVLGVMEEAGGEERRALPLPRGLLRAGVLATLPVLFGTALLFPLLPRHEAGLLQELARGDDRLSGFSETVRLGDIGKIKQSDEIVMRVKLQGEAARHRWRGLALDTFDGRAWSLSTAASKSQLIGKDFEIAPRVPDAPILRQTITLEPIRSRVLFHVEGAVEVRSKDFKFLDLDRWGNIQRGLLTRKQIQYEVVSQPGRRSVVEDDELLERCLVLPHMDEDVGRLARRVTRLAETPAARAARIEQYLRSANPYTLEVNDAGLEEPVSTFLLERRPGHCEYFASGMAVMLRSLDIPARIVNGYQQGSWASWSGSYVVRQRDAHSWVEAWLPGRGWTTFDPTPDDTRILGDQAGLVRELWRNLQIAWDDHVVGFGASHQARFVATVRDVVADARLALRGWGAPILGIGALGALTWFVRARRRREAAACPVSFYAEVLRYLRRHGHVLEEGQTAREFADEVATTQGDEVGVVMHRITEIYYATRFGGARVDETEASPLLVDLKRLVGERA